MIMSQKDLWILELLNDNLRLKNDALKKICPKSPEDTNTNTTIICLDFPFLVFCKVYVKGLKDRQFMEERL